MTTQFTQSLIQAPFRVSKLLTIVKRIIPGKVFLKGILSLFFITIFRDNTSAQHTVKDNLGDAYFFYINDYPHNSPFWGDDDALTNGIAHDNKNWYITALGTTTTGKANGDWIIRKIPVVRDLMADYNNPPDNSASKSDFPSLKFYEHAGDLDCYLYKGNNTYYLIVPFTGPNTYRDSLNIFGLPVLDNNGFPIQIPVKHPPVIAFFRASDLHFINYANLTGQKDVGWCALSPVNGDLYSSEDSTNTFRRYSINWNMILTQPTKHNALKLSQIDTIKNRNGDMMRLHNMQGGEFTPDGSLIYVNCGIIECVVGPFGGGGGPQENEDGINVFDTLTWRLVQHSTNKEKETYPAPGSVIRHSEIGCFDYTFDNTGCSGEEPEGLTIWDMDKVPGHDPHVTGQLHVISYNHNTNVFHENEVFLKHYKSFKRPDDITVFATTAKGEPATNPKITAFLNQKSPNPNCADITFTPHLSVFPPGKTPVTFTITDHATVKVQCTVIVNVINKQDECSIATRIYACDKIVVDNYGATHSVAPIFPCNGGSAKDVWFTITPPSPVFSVETYQVAGGLTDLDMQAFSGTCGHLQEIACDDSSGDDKHAKITFQNLPNSNPIYIRITDHDGTHFGKFGIYAKKIEIGANIFNATQFVSGDGPHVSANPTLIGDVNGDGKADLIFLYHDQTKGTIVRTKISNGDGTYTAYEQTLGEGASVFKNPTLIGDVNGDGKADLVFIYYNTLQGTVVRTKISNGNGTFTPYETVLGDGPQVFVHPAFIGDVNGDGKADLVFVYYNTAVGTIVRTKISNGNGTYTPYETALRDGPHVFARPTIIADVNGDKKADLIFLYYDQTKGTIVRTKISNGDGTYKPYEQTLGDGPYVFTYPTLVGDVNGDGKADLIFVYYNTTNGTTVRTKLSNGDGTYSAYEAITGDGSGVFTYPTLTGDVNGDGKTDLLFVGQNWKSCGLNIRVKMSNGDGTWCQGWQGMPDGGAVHNYPTLTGDINGDGRTDLVFTFSNDTSGLIIRTKIAQNYSLCTTGNNITNPQQQDDPIKIYPNPTTGIFSIATKIQGEIEVEILDMNGRQMRPKERFIGTRRFDLSSLPNGIYLIQIVDVRLGKIKTERILKIK